MDTTEPQIDDDADVAPSKTRRKREMAELQDLGEALVGLPADRLAEMTLPDALRSAVEEARRIRKFGALRRQFQYIGKVMRGVDADAIRAQLDTLQGHSRAHVAWLHRLERWRERLLHDEQAVGEFVAAHPAVDVQHLRTLLRNARREHESGRPPRAYREIFQLLKDLVPETGAGPQQANDPDTDTDTP